MQTFTLAMRSVFRYVFLCIALVAILWALLPDNRLFLQSLLLGMSASVINGLVLFAKTYRIGLFATDPTVRPKGTGMMTRIVLAGFVVYLTMRFPHLFILSGALIGLFLVPGFTLLFGYRFFK
ncbi:ATP synthase subunit I [Brevibacillus dissolubilis]|uniref:ATP synthase subunit I n=1 Tax=Brevibacillus dissolubilis TaxID=1844116 RepID=UPI001115D657|nr:ATP synthase subunit I [Brevibacillus dissolubilis]